MNIQMFFFLFLWMLTMFLLIRRIEEVKKYKQLVNVLNQQRTNNER